MRNYAIEKMIRCQYSIEDNVKVEVKFESSVGESMEFTAEWWIGGVMNHEVIVIRTDHNEIDYGEMN